MGMDRELTLHVLNLHKKLELNFGNKEIKIRDKKGIGYKSLPSINLVFFD